MTHCRNCLLPGTVPGAVIDSSGLCVHCRTPRDEAAVETARQRREQELDTYLAELKRSPGPHGVVCLSGGKDSLLLLYRLKIEHGLDVIPFTSDMNIPDVAWDNIRRTLRKLDLESRHIVHKPDIEFYLKMYRYLLKNQEERGAVRSVCYACAPLFESEVLKEATLRKIPAIFAGYAPGQPDPDRMLFEFSREMIETRDWTPPVLRRSGLFGDAELANFWNPQAWPSGTVFPRYLAPFHAWKYSQEEAMRVVVELGLAASKKSASPIHSNCPLNWLLMYSDLKHLGYNPYSPEFASLIREGKANRAFWRFGQPAVNFMIRHKLLLGKNVKTSFEWLGLKEDDLRITRVAEEESTPVTPP
jgi:hypothetical protein